METALSGDVAATLFDDDGSAIVATILAASVDTEFGTAELTRILSEPQPIPRDWEVGEAIAETYFSNHHDCLFPWPDGRDIRKRKSSLPGADLVGFHGVNANVQFACGEVKTSYQDQHPPSVVKYGEKALNKQLVDLRESETIRWTLIQYLGARATHALWLDSFKTAVGNYFNSGCKQFMILGFIVRDVEPRKEDLKETHSIVLEGCAAETSALLVALYLPKGCIDGIGARVAELREGCEHAGN